MTAEKLRRKGQTEKHEPFGHGAEIFAGGRLSKAERRRAIGRKGAFWQPLDHQFEEIFKNKRFQAWRER